MPFLENITAVRNSNTAPILSLRSRRYPLPSPFSPWNVCTYEHVDLEMELSEGGLMTLALLLFWAPQWLTAPQVTEI